MSVPTRVVGGHRLETLLGSRAYHVHTWQGTTPAGMPCVVRTAASRVSDDYGNFLDIRPRLAPLAPALRALVAIAPHPGVAPWSSFFVEPEGTFVLVRSHYPERLHERFTPALTGDASGGPRSEFLAQIAGLAAAIDHLSSLLPSSELLVAPNNLLMAGDRAVLADYGTRLLGDTVEAAYCGPRPVNWDVYDSFLPFLQGRDSSGRKPSFDLAAAYFNLRTGHPALMRASWFEHSIQECLPDAMRNLNDYKARGTIDAGELSGARERQVIERALAVDVGSQFQSCADLVNALMA